jgi:hypothetical protein
MWLRRLSGQTIFPSPQPPQTPTQSPSESIPPENERIKDDVKRHSGGRVPIPADVVSRMRQLRGSGMSLRKVATAVAAEFRRPVMPPTSVARVVRRTARSG